MKAREVGLISVSVISLLLTAGCPKSSTTAPPAAPVPAAAVSKPKVDLFVADPSILPAGQPASLRWSVSDAATVRIDNGVGEVELNGSRSIKPNATTTYQLEATNPAGTSVAAVTVSVNAPPPSLMAPSSTDAASGTTQAELLSMQLQDIRFAYDREEVLDSDKAVLDQDIMILKNILASDPTFGVTIEGHCDERGSAEYNLALGDRRANFVRELGVRAGLPENKLNVISFGKERPKCIEPTETCLANNRRVHFTPAK